MRCDSEESKENAEIIRYTVSEAPFLHVGGECNAGCGYRQETIRTGASLLLNRFAMNLRPFSSSTVP
ncbi:hypothetical protein M378DRAFT_170519, partial [Amanita muscaria Koide BX008]